MTDATLLAPRRLLRLTFDDGETADFPYLWLRDNAPDAFHPVTEERVLDLLDIPDDIAPEAVRIEGGRLVIDWGFPAHRSVFALDWLAGNRPGRGLADPAAVAPVPWRAGDAGAVVRAEAAALMADDAALARWLEALLAGGLSVVGGLPADPDAGIALARRVGFLRQTNFGTVFEVISKPDPNNLAYTAEALPLHTDLPNQALPPGFQFLHCLAGSAQGGRSVFADGFALAGTLRETDPDAFDRLARTAIPFRFHDGACDIRSRASVIGLGPSGALREIRWNAHIAGVCDLPTAEIEPWYRAYRRFMALTRDAAFRIELQLAPGEMAVFDNRRVLHGRTAFDPSTGRRHLRGCYVDRGEAKSRLRVLARARG